MNCRTRVALFLLCTTALILLGGYVLFDRYGLAMALILCTGFNVFVYFFADSKIQQALGGVELEGQDAWGLGSCVQAQAKSQKIKPPRVFLLENAAPQILIMASACNSRLVITRGLLENLSTQQVEALVAYHLSSLRLQASFAASVGVCVAACVFYITDFFDMALRLLLVEKVNPRVRMSQAFSALVAPLVGMVLSFLLGSQKLCDAELGPKHAPALAEALWHLQAYSKTKSFAVRPAFLPLLMLPVAEGTWAARLQHLSPTAQRIEKLVGHYPI